MMRLGVESKTPVDEGIVARLGETEYTGLVDPAFLRPARCGDFYRRLDFPDRYDANQLIRVRCGEAGVLLKEVESLYAGTGLNFRKVSGYDPVVWAKLSRDLEDRGWTVSSEAMKVLRRPPERTGNAALEIRVVDPRSPDLEALYSGSGTLDRGFAFARGEFQRVGGEYLVGYHASRPVCCSGWFVAVGTARFRHVYTLPSERGKGFATSLIRYVQQVPAVQAQDELAIFVGMDGPEALYESLGFRTAGRFFSARTTLT